MQGSEATTDTNRLEIIVFPGGFNWPIFVAQEKNYFAGRNLSVNVTATRDSKFQMSNLIDGKFDIAMTAIDNVIAYMEGQGAVETQSEPDIFAFMGCDNGFLRLVSVPEVATYQDLKGKKIGVDALTTGYAFVLLKILEGAGLAPDDYELVQAGGGVQRFDALMKKEIDATLLISPFEVLAERAGFHRLANGSDVVGPYQGVVGAARRDWARDHKAHLVGYIRAFREALDWLYDPANKDDAIAILMKNVPNLSIDVATVSFDVLVDKKFGFFRDISLDLAGVTTVLDLRSQYGVPPKKLTDPSRYYDLSFYDTAAKSG